MQRNVSAGDSDWCYRSQALEEKDLLVPHIRALAELQIEIQALLSVIIVERMRANKSLVKRPLSKTSDAAFLAVLAEQEDVLLTTQNQISHLYDIPDDLSSESWDEILLEQKLGALPVQLQAILNMQCRERELASPPGSTDLVDERTMLRMVTENQNRTEILRKIQHILAEKRAVRLNMCLVRGGK